MSPGRRAGLLVPLFSISSSASWGIGEIGDIPAFARWLQGARQSMLQLLPINEMAPGERSPYSALSAMAIDPLFISVYALHDFVAAGGEAALGPDFRRSLERIRSLPKVDYAAVRAVKQRALRLAFARFRDDEWRRSTRRAENFRSFVADQAWWLDEYALFRAIHAREDERPWTEWDQGLRDRERDRLLAVREELSGEILFRQYLQWIAEEQWQAARAAAAPVALFGDLPFVVAIDSADVWAYQHEFQLDASVGVPPDAFSDVGQDWRLPLYRWDVICDRQYDWQRERARRSASLYSGYRIDHVVGFYRTYARSHDGAPGRFSPEGEAEQLAQGERLMTLFLDSGATIIVEDLGTVPGFVRASLTRLGLPGYRLLRWERRWTEEGQPFIDPAAYPAVSVAASGTHDTETMACWWDSLTLAERETLAAIPALRGLVMERPETLAGSHAALRDALLEALFGSGSDYLSLPIQDVFGWRNRINEPATVTGDNWTFRLPWPVDQLDAIPEARERQEALGRWCEQYGRG